MSSLVQQRLAVERRSLAGKVCIGVGVLGLLCSVGLVLLTGDWAYSLMGLIFSIVWLAVGLYLVRVARSSLQAFEEEHGSEAGVRR